MSQENSSERQQLHRARSTFATRTATDNQDQLSRRWSLFRTSTTVSPRDEQRNPSDRPSSLWSGFDGVWASSPTLLNRIKGFFTQPGASRDSEDARKSSGAEEALLASATGFSRSDYGATRQFKRRENHSHEHSMPRSTSIALPPGTKTAKLGTFAGVFVPTTLNVLSILMFLRFGFILGQSGVLGMMGMLVACYAINLVTTMSVSAIATNGTVRGGGAYYLISRSLGPEFGGSIGLVYYIGCVFNTGMNAVGLIDCLTYNFGVSNGGWAQWLPDGFWFGYLWATVVLLLCTAICLAGSGLFARASNGLLVILLISTFSIPLSAFLVRPFESRRLGIQYTGLSFDTFKGNLMPHFTRGADGSQVKGRETWQDLFGILFPATGGIFAGASMSGDLKHPSKAIPKGTLYGLALTLFSYAVVILAIAATVTRASLYRNVNVIQDVNISGVVVLMGEFATTSFSVLMGVIGSAKLLQALARDSLIPGLGIFGQGTKGNDEPTFAIFITYIIAQLTMLTDINQIAALVTMTYLLTFLVTNLACFLLTVSSAPNFRPSFHFFNWQTAFAGTIISGAVMFFVDQVYAAVSVATMAFIFLLIHYTTPPKSWGDVSQSLIYHQVRKYLLRLRSDHIKFWRPSVLLLLNDPRRQYRLVQFCNSLKKGGLFILGHVIVTHDFAAAVQEAKKQQTNWQKYIDFSKIKAFINVCISPAIEWGARNIVLSAGLGGMRPNIVIMGFYNLNDLRHSGTLIDIPSPQPSRPASIKEVRKAHSKRRHKKRAQKEAERLSKGLPTDMNRPEGAISASSYVTVLEDLLLRLQINVAVAKGFQDLELPAPKPSKRDQVLSYLGWKVIDDEENEKKYIDLWPIQMSAELASEGDDKQRVLTTNFDTYTLILQLGCILDTVPSWKRAYQIRVCVFVEYESDVDEEHARVTSLLTSLRIQAEVLVFWLAAGGLARYEVIVNGRRSEELMQVTADVNEALEEEEWWAEMQNFRRRSDNTSVARELEEANSASAWPTNNFQNFPGGASFQGGATVQGATTLHGGAQMTPGSQIKFKSLRKLLRKARRRTSISSKSGSIWGPMRADSSIISGQLIDSHRAFDSGSETSSSSEDEDTTGSESEDSAASEGDLMDGRLESAKGENLRRSKSLSNVAKSTIAGDNSSRSTPTSPHLPPRDTTNRLVSRAQQVQSAEPAPRAPSPDLTSSTCKPSMAAAKKKQRPPRPPFDRHKSLPKFTSRPQPVTQLAADETQGRSIMFADSSPSPRTMDPLSSIYRHTPSSSRPAQPLPLQVQQGPQSLNALLASPASPTFPVAPTPPAAPSTAFKFPAFDSSALPAALASPAPPLAAQAIPLSFNDLPSRAQHLILNELMVAQSGETTVLFTTLPTPLEGTCTSEEESVRYLSDLEVLCQGLPPVLLVHSNSISVTMNL